jgi:hypothetical protein
MMAKQDKISWRESYKVTEQTRRDDLLHASSLVEMHGFPQIASDIRTALALLGRERLKGTSP